MIAEYLAILLVGLLLFIIALPGILIVVFGVSNDIREGREAGVARKKLKLERTKLASSDYELIAETSLSASSDIRDSAIEKIRLAPIPESLPVIIEILNRGQASPDFNKAIIEILCSYKSLETTSLLVKHLEHYGTVIPELVNNRGSEDIELLLVELENSFSRSLSSSLGRNLLESLSECKFKKKLSAVQLERYSKVERDFISKELPGILSRQTHCAIESHTSYEIAKMINTVEEWQVLENILADFVVARTKTTEYHSLLGVRRGRNVDSPRDPDEDDYEPTILERTEILYDCSKFKELINNLEMLRRLIEQSLPS